MSRKRTRLFTVKSITAMFVLCEATLILFIVGTRRVVAYDVEWLFYAFAFAYVVGLVLVKRNGRVPKSGGIK